VLALLSGFRQVVGRTLLGVVTAFVAALIAFRPALAATFIATAFSAATCLGTGFALRCRIEAAFAWSLVLAVGTLSTTLGTALAIAVTVRATATAAALAAFRALAAFAALGVARAAIWPRFTHRVLACEVASCHGST
jgi:hypothetical protein